MTAALDALKITSLSNIKQAAQKDLIKQSKPDLEGLSQVTDAMEKLGLSYVIDAITSLNLKLKIIYVHFNREFRRFILFK